MPSDYMSNKTYVEMYYPTHTTEELTEEVARILARMCDSFFFEPGQTFKTWETIDTDDISHVACSEDLTDLVAEIREIFGIFGMEPEGAADDPEETVIDAEIVHHVPHNMVGFQGEVSQDATVEADLKRAAATEKASDGCEICKVGPRSLHVPITDEWVCLGCWRKMTTAPPAEETTIEVPDLKSAVVTANLAGNDITGLLTPDLASTSEQT